MKTVAIPNSQNYFCGKFRVMKRITTADYAKGIAVVLMIQVHSMELFIQDDVFQSNWGKVSLFLGGVPAAPLFMMIMGYFIAFRNKNNLVIRGLKLIGLGILLNIGLNFHLLYNIFFEAWTYDPWAYILGVDILPLAGLSLITIALLKKFLGENPFYWIFPALIVSGLSYFITNIETQSIKYVLSFIIGGTYWSYFPLIPWLAYPIIGYSIGLYLKKRKTTESPKQIALFYAIITVGFLYGLSYGFEVSSKLPTYYQHDIVFFLWAVSFAVLMVSLLYFTDKAFKENIILKYLRFLGRKVTSIYIIQWLIIGNTATEIYKSKELWFWPVSTVVLLVISSLIVFSVDKLTQNYSGRIKQKTPSTTVINFNK